MGDGGGEKKADETPIPPAQLVLVVQKALLSLCDAIGRCWFDKYYKSADDEDTDL